MNKQKIIAIVGPTATGKSLLAVSIAKLIGGEVISADSRQIYTGMDIGTGKITNKEKCGVYHYLLDISEPKKRINVKQYMKLAANAIQDIHNRGKVAIVCGGTGFYVEELLFPSSLPKVEPDKKLRAKLEKKSVDELFSLLKKKDSKRAKNIDAKNKVRIIRALEIIEKLGKVPLRTKRESPYNVLIIELDAPIDFIKSKIHTRLIKRLNSGLIAEIKKLHKNGLSYKALESFGLEYKWGSFFIQARVDKKTFITNLERDIFAYAKRQKTWFRKMRNHCPNTKIISVLDKKSLQAEAFQSIKIFLKTK